MAATTLLGDEAIESSRDTLMAGQAEAFPFRALASGVAGTVHVYVDSHNAAKVLIVGVYTNLNGHPGSLLTTGSLSSPRAGAWNTQAVDAAALISGTTYWLAVLGTGGTLSYRDRWHGPCKAETSAQTNLGALASAWRTGVLYSTCPISAYVSLATTTFPVGPPAPVELTPPVIPSPPVPPVEVTPVPPPPPAAPANSAPPVILGAATEGQSLSAGSGTWTGSPTSYAYQWEDCDSSGANCVNVSGAVASSYTLTASDVGHTMRVTVTAANAGGSTSSTSAATTTVTAVLLPPPPPPPLPPTNIVLPSISGRTIEGTTLVAAAGSWTDGPTSFAYQWQDCDTAGENCTDISGVTSASHMLTAGEVQHSVRVVVTATNAGGSTPATSLATATVVAAPPPPPPSAPTNTMLPSVSGSVIEGGVLTASNGLWSGSPTSFAYQWQDCDSAGTVCANITGATASSYTLTAGDVGSTVRVLVTATNVGGSTLASSTVTVTVAASPPPPPPPAAPTNTVAPLVSGTVQLGQTLSASAGTWTGNPTSYVYQWQDCSAAGAGCANISGATSTTYMTVGADVGHTVRVVVTATNAGGSTPQASAVTVIVPEAGGACTTTVTPSTSAGTIASTIAAAANGATICMEAGIYPEIVVSGAKHTSYVTVRPRGNAHVVASDWELVNSSYLRFEKLESTEYGFRTRNVINHIQWIDNRFTGYRGLVVGNTNPSEDLLIEGNTFEKLIPKGTETAGCTTTPGVGEGQGVTLEYVENNIVIKGNRFKENAWHYIQGGQNTTVENNLFEGPIPTERHWGEAGGGCTHLNVWQIFDGSEDDVFSNNVVRGEPGHPAAVTPILFEHGVPSPTGPYPCSELYTNIKLENNLFIYASTAYVVDIMDTTNLTYNHNTVVGGQYGTWLDRSDICKPGKNLTAEHNIAVNTQSAGASQRFLVGDCTGICKFDYNVSDDETANAAGSTHYDVKWKPSWEGIIYGEPGLYIPTGLPFAAGYEGKTGP